MKLSLPSLSSVPALAGLAAQLTSRYQAANPRERLFLLVGAVLVVGILVYMLVVPLEESVSDAHERVDRKQADLLRMRQIAPELVGSTLPPAASQESLVIIVDRSARESGLAAALASTEPTGKGALNVRLEKASFDMLVAWLARLSQQNGIRVDNATIESTSSPGIVNAAVLLRTG
jgi:general secretion pathway protein M